MDNLTHSLVGLLVGETAATISTGSPTGIPAAKKRTALLGLMLVGSNFPDFDLLYTALTRSKIDYLLHHRGYTHTIVGALLATAILYGLCELWMRRERLQPTPKDRMQLICAALLGPLLHVALDYTNNYGVHPFWPLHDGWLYGDSVFIIEPMLWAVAAPLAVTLHSQWARYAIMLVLIAGIALCFFSGLVPTASMGVYALVAVLLPVLTRFRTRRTGLFAGIGCWLMVTFVFAGSSHFAAANIEAVAAAQFPGTTTLDHVLTPMPVNPLCWEVLLVQKDVTDLVLRRATMSLVPGLMSAVDCPAGVAARKITAPLQNVARPDTPTIHWRGQVTTSIATLQELAARDCEARGLMQFARAPWATRSDPAGEWAGQWLIGDLRYDREPQLGFTEFAIGSESARCPRHVPPWLPPRKELE